MKIFYPLIISFVCFQCAAAELSPTRIGYAYRIDSDALLYTEHHHELIDGDAVTRSKVLYKDVNGLVFAEKNLDFSENLFLPEFSLINKATVHREITRYLDNTYEVQFLESTAKAPKEKPLQYPDGAISDAGFDNFIISHWQELTEGQKFTRDFLIPGMLRFFKFRIYQEETVEQATGRHRILHIEPANFFLRAFAGTSKLYYKYDRPELKKFHGVSNMRDEKGENYRVTISYEKVGYEMDSQGPGI